MFQESVINKLKQYMISDMLGINRLRIATTSNSNNFHKIYDNKKIYNNPWNIYLRELYFMYISTNNCSGIVSTYLQ